MILSTTKSEPNENGKLFNIKTNEGVEPFVQKQAKNRKGETKDRNTKRKTTKSETKIGEIGNSGRKTT